MAAGRNSNIIRRRPYRRMLCVIRSDTFKTPP
jgi:hypothetical protein